VLDHAVVAQGRVPGGVAVGELLGQDLLEADDGGHAGGHGGGQRAHPAALAGPEQGDPGRVEALLGGQAGHGGERLTGPVLEALVAPVAARAATARLVPGQAGEPGGGQHLGLVVPAVPLGRPRAVHERHRRERAVALRAAEAAGEQGSLVLEVHVHVR
jgi:hypothetical protein